MNLLNPTINLKSYQIWYSQYIFVNSFSDFHPRIKILLFLDSAKAGLLKNVQNHFLRCFRSQEMSKSKVGTFFWNTLYILIFYSTLSWYFTKIYPDILKNIILIFYCTSSWHLTQLYPYILLNKILIFDITLSWYFTEHHSDIRQNIILIFYTLTCSCVGCVAGLL